MTIDKKRFTELIELGADIEFLYNGKKYTILAWIDDGISIGEQNTDNESIYSNCKDLLQNCIIDGTPLLNALPKIDITFHT